MNKIYFFALLLVCIGCSSEVKRIAAPDELIPKDTMVMVLKDLMVLESHVKLKFPSVNQHYKIMRKSGDLILKKYHMDSARFDASLDYYGSRQDVMQEINSLILDEVNQEVTKLSDK